MQTFGQHSQRHLRREAQKLLAGGGGDIMMVLFRYLLVAAIAAVAASAIIGFVVINLVASLTKGRFVIFSPAVRLQ
jgi:hypothetical protein